MDSASSQQQRSLSDLPVGTLSHVSSYLPLPSRALFAIALNYYHDTDSSTAERDVLDFGDIEKELAAKLTDDDVKGVLLSINAVNNLKTLRLTNLFNITGAGLEPLRRSTKIEKIDLSLVGDHESCDLSPAPPISCTDVLPILDSIIDMGGASSLKLLIFPKEWRKERNTESEFHAFLVRYNDFLCNRVDACLNCGDNLEEGEMVQMEAIEYGTQCMTCYDCMKHYCHDCVEEGDEGEIYFMSEVCWTCNRRYCLHCSREWNCNCCEEWFCVECKDTKQCTQCDESVCLYCISNRGCRNSCCEGKIWCIKCVGYGYDLKLCETCDAEYCADCNSTNPHLSAIDYCDDCRKNLCGECRVFKCKNNVMSFSSCAINSLSRLYGKQIKRGSVKRCKLKSTNSKVKSKIWRVNWKVFILDRGDHVINVFHADLSWPNYNRVELSLPSYLSLMKARDTCCSDRKGTYAASHERNQYMKNTLSCCCANLVLKTSSRRRW